MYEIGDFIVRANTGVCKVVDILNLDMSGIDRSKLYYQLVPLDDDKAKIYIPTESAHLVTRKVMTMEEAMKLIEQVADIEVLNVTNDKLREQKYKEIVKGSNPRELLQIIKTIYLRKKERLDQGKKNTAADENYYRLAEKQLFSELCVALKKSNDDIHKLIVMSVKKNNTSQIHT